MSVGRRHRPHPDALAADRGRALHRRGRRSAGDRRLRDLGYRRPASSALAQTSELLDQLRGRRPRGGDGSSLAAEHPGTPFLEGPTVTVAGATLLQRVAAAVGNVGGTIQSSQVDVLGTQAKDGSVGLVVSCEMEQPSLAEAALRSRGRHALPVRRSTRRAGAADDGAE